MRQVILVHYNEIGLKGKNRGWFENLLVNNIRAALRPFGDFEVAKQHDRILISHNNLTIQPFNNLIIECLKKIFGIAYFCPADIVESDLGQIKQTALMIATESNFQTFRLTTKRAWKQFPLNSEQVNCEVAGVILENLPSKKVSLKNANLNIRVELNPRQTFIYSQKIKGAGGLPIGASGRMLALISGGIDSPVASYLMMRRGAAVDFIHFSSYPFIDQKSEDKILELVKQLSLYNPCHLERGPDQFNPESSENNYWGAVEEPRKKPLSNNQPPKLFLVRIGDLQKQIVALGDPRYRILLYRALMFKIAEKIALENNYQALITGESLGQVASQTIENITATSQDINLPILRPLIGLDKEEIIELALSIGTYNTSIEPHQDCCSMFSPEAPITRARPENLRRELNKLDLKNLLTRVEIKKLFPC
jgi:tRNA uracil 4-sulfurtransferase